MNFRDLSAGTDQAVLDAVGEDALLDGRGVRVLFSSPWMGPEVGTLRTALQQPMAYLPESTLGEVAEESVLEHRGSSYDVVDLEPDGTGWIGLVLRPK